MFTVSVTELIQFRACRRQWWLTREGWESKSPPIPLWLGHGIHQALESYYSSTPAREEALSKYALWYLTSSEDLVRQFPYSDDSVLAEFQEQYDLGLKMLENYFEFDSSQAPRWEPLEVEQRITLPVSPSDRTAFLSGKIDLVLRMPDGIWLADHKTASSAPDLESLDLDDQLTGYVYLFYRQREKLPQGVYYNVLLKRAPGPPKILKSGGLSRDKSQLTSLRFYEQGIRNLGLPRDDYLEMIEVFRAQGWSRYFNRVAVTKSISQLQSYHRRLVETLKDISLALNYEESRYPSPGFGCRGCPYRSPCLIMESGGDVQEILDGLFMKREPEDL